jgi:hypothetical protein
MTNPPAEDEQEDFVDVFYIDLAQAEASLVELLTGLNEGSERVAHETLKSPDAKKKIISLIEASGIQGFDLQELIEGIDAYWADKDRRNRYIHDEWYVGLYESNAIPATPGIATCERIRSRLG